MLGAEVNEATRSPVDRVLDALSDLAIWAVAIWTVAYHVGRALSLGTNLLLAVTAALTIVAAVPTWRRHQRTNTDGLRAAEPVSGYIGGQSRLFGLLGLAAVLLTVAAVGVHWAQTRATYALGWGLSVLALVPLVWTVLSADRPSRSSADTSSAEPASASCAGRRHSVLGWAASILVAGVAVFLSYLSLLTVRQDADDVFYVNKAVFVAEHGVIPIRDTIYSDQVLPALRGAGTAPVQSIEVLQGALAHMLGVSGGTVVYMVTTPIASFLAVWALWRLVRGWSRQRAFIAVAIAIAYLMWGVRDGYGLGAFFIGRIWQGKVMFVCLALPLLYVLLTSWARYRRRYDAVLLLGLGAVTVGLSSTATFVVPPIAAAVAVALLLCGFRHWWGALLPLLYPVVSGLIVAVVAASSGGGEFGEVAFSSFGAYHHVVGSHLWGALGLVAILLAPWLVLRGPARVVAAAGSAAAIVVLAPGVPEFLNGFTGAGPVLWRLTWVPAIPALVGVLATVAWPAADGLVRRASLVVVPAALLAVIIAGGQLLWLSRTTSLMDGPTWKYGEQFLTQARWITRTYHGDGPVLAPWQVMRALALTTTQVHGVDPRVFYLEGLDEPPDQHAARIRLSAAMKNGNTPPPASLGRDLELLDVSYVCLDPAKKLTKAALLDLGWHTVAADHRLTCYKPQA